MSNNRSPPNPSSFPFLIVEYENDNALVGRDTNYQETLASIKKLFNALRNTPDEDIRINAHIDEIDRSCRIADGIWSELLPRLTVVQVAVDCPAQSNKPNEQPSKPTKSEEPTKAEDFVNVHRRPWDNWGNPVTHMYTTRISLDRTFGQLIEQVKQQENIAHTYYEFRYGNSYPSEIETLAELGVTPGSVVEFMAE